tara:strand:+ start:32856 stop:33437 length:582 start_codon:yes stop_codon:yes gene_type:complete
MFQIGKTIVSEDVIHKDFVCNLAACKGECCIAGEAGAPVEEEEAVILKEIYPKVKPFLRPDGIKAIEEQGTYITTDFDELETPLVNGAECAYVTFTPEGVASCGIEDAYNAGEVDFRKPVSCHLYPVRIQQYSEFAAVNYHKWPICDDACTLGKELQVPVYIFTKAALLRKFGQEWYTELEEIAELLKKENAE